MEVESEENPAGLVLSTTHFVHLKLRSAANHRGGIPMVTAPLPSPCPLREDLESMIWKAVDLLAQPQVRCCGRLTSVCASRLFALDEPRQDTVCGSLHTPQLMCSVAG
jgi:hypothetical protein